MRDDLWADEDEPTRRPWSVLTILAIAAIPWIVVAGLVFLPDRGDPDRDAATSSSTPADDARERGGTGTVPAPVGGDRPGRDTADADAAAGDPAAEPGPVGGPSSGDADAGQPAGAMPGAGPLPGRDLAPGSGVVAAHDDHDTAAIAATATIVARAWTTGVSPHLPLPGIEPGHPTRYAEHVAVEAIGRPGPDLAVATVLVVLLEELADGLAADLRRIAVPLQLTAEGPQPAGAPWWLPGPELTTTPPAAEPHFDPELLARAADALVAAGYGDVEVAALHRTADGPWIAEVRGTAPGQEPFDGAVWLTPTGDWFTVLGWSVAAPTPTMEGDQP